MSERTGAPPDMDFERAFMAYDPFGEFAPGFDDPIDFEEEATPCEHCGAEVTNEMPGHVHLCDPCAVANALACGDWDEQSTAAFRRLNPCPITC